MSQNVSLKLPDIPKEVSPELYNYYVVLHQNLKLLEAAINKINK